MNLSNYIENSLNNYKQLEIYFYFVINSKEYIFPIQSDSLNIKKDYGYDLIKNIVKKINNNNLIIINNSIKYIVSLKDCEEDNNKNFYINNYELKQCRKQTLIPKQDLPGYSPTSLLENMINEKISFVSKNSLNIMLTEKYEEEFQRKNNVNNININTQDNLDYFFENNNNIHKKDENKNKENLCRNNCIII